MKMLANPVISVVGTGLEEGTLDLSAVATATATGIVTDLAAFDAAAANAILVVASVADCLRELRTRATPRACSAEATAADTEVVLVGAAAFP